MRFYMLTLGCPKNEVDSDGMTQVLIEAGHRPVDKPAKADTLIVNTCGFIDIAIQESTNALKKLAARKKPGQALVAAGCLAQRYEEQLKSEVPQIDAFVGTRDLARIADVAAAEATKKADIAKTKKPLGRERKESLSTVFVPGAKDSAYLKIADGCNASCAFCVIPQIKGPYWSKAPKQIVEEARRLGSSGAKEIVLIAQDTTAYGMDRKERDALADLIPAILAAAPELVWLRLMYAYPTSITDRLIDVMARYPQVCHYLDLPLQHAHPAVLKRMNRPNDMEAIRDLIHRLRAAMPDIALRTSFIVGYPGETETEFRTLLDFMEEIAFDRVGVFTYSREESTPAATLPGQIPDTEKRRRFERAMEFQQKISLERNRAQIGRELTVLVEGVADEAEVDDAAFPIVGRTYRDAPEVDGLIFCQGEARPGDIVQVKVTGALEYDLLGRIVKASRAAAGPVLPAHGRMP